MQKVVESLYKSKMAKQKSPKGNVSPVLMKYLSSSNTSNRGQMSSVDEEDVLVMDGLPIMRPSPSPSSSPKTEVCQFAHGKDELRPTRFQTIKNKSEAQICKSFITGSCIYGSKCRFIHQVMTDSALVLATQTEDHPISKTPITPITFKSQVTNTSGKPEQTLKTTPLITKPVQSGATSTTTGKDYWSPQDDGIEVTLPSHHGKSPPPREKVDKCIDSILYCPSNAGRRRLLVFAEICPEC